MMMMMNDVAASGREVRAFCFCVFMCKIETRVEENSRSNGSSWNFTYAFISFGIWR